MTVTATTSTMTGHYRFRDVVRMEWIKLRSLRSTAWVLLITVLGAVAIAVLADGAVKWSGMGPDQRAHFDPTNNALAGIIPGILAIGVLGVLTMSSEYSSGMVRATLAAVPNRSMVLAAKAVVFGGAALVVGEVATFAAFLAGQAALPSPAPPDTLGQPGVLRAVVLSGAFLALNGLVGLGVATAVRHTAGAVATFVCGLFVLPMVVTMIGQEAVINSFGRYVPIFIAANSLSAVKPMAGADFLGPWIGFGVVCLYAAAALAVGGVLLARRDA